MYRKAMLLLITLFVLTTQPCLAQLSDDQERRLKELENKEEAWKEWEKMKPDQEEALSGITDKQIIQKAREARENDFFDSIIDEEPGRFQALRMNNNIVFIIDSKEGHLWVWVSQTDKQGTPGEFLIYQGQLAPGSYMGEIINKTNKK